MYTRLNEVYQILYICVITIGFEKMSIEKDNELRKTKYIHIT